MMGDDVPRRDENDPNEPTKRSRRKRRGGKTGGELRAPTLGYIPATPDSPVPALADPEGDAATAYVQALDRLQAASPGRILLVARPDGGPDDAAALNLAVAATRLGLRCVVIDGDDGGGGPTQFLQTRSGPGLADLAAGTVDLKQASRLLTIDADNRLPMIPAGTADAPGEFDATAIADPIDAISEHSDLVLIDVPVRDAYERLTALGAHADGSILLVGDKLGARERARTAERLATVGAPVIGLIEWAPAKRRKRRKRGS